MGFACGIVGLPNVGKSTIFNAMTAAGAQTANYPFCTIEPNTGVVPVPDPRIDILAEIAGSQKIIPITIEFVDIAGLVKGASQGEGLGNQFLGHIRSVDAIVHVVRCFEDENITHVHESVSPKRDVEIIETELLLADLLSVEKRVERVRRAAKGGDKALKAELELLEEAHKHLADGTSLRTLDIEGLDTLGLITNKPQLFLANVAESEVTEVPESTSHPHLKEIYEVAKASNCELVVLCGNVESEIAQLEREERAAFLEDLGLQQSGLDRLARSGYNLLDLITFFTVGPKEAHAWTCGAKADAVEAAGKIHSDFAKGFIRAEVISYDDYVSCKGELAAREQGKMRLEGKAYQMQDGDIVHFRFNV